jgi:hypothetical protein
LGAQRHNVRRGRVNYIISCLMIRDCRPSALLNLSSRIGCYLFCGFICTAFPTQKWLPFYINVLPVKTAEESTCSNLVSSAPIRASRSMHCCASTFPRPQGRRALRSSIYTMFIKNVLSDINHSYEMFFDLSLFIHFLFAV